MGQQRFPHSSRADQQDVALLELHVFQLLPGIDPLIMVIDGHGKGFLCILLADHVLIEHKLDILRLGQLHEAEVGFLADFFFDDLVAEFNAFITDIDPRSCHKLADLFLGFATK